MKNRYSLSPMHLLFYVRGISLDMPQICCSYHEKNRFMKISNKTNRLHNFIVCIIERVFSNLDSYDIDVIHSFSRKNNERSDFYSFLLISMLYSGTSTTQITCVSFGSLNISECIYQAVTNCIRKTGYIGRVLVAPSFHVLIYISKYFKNMIRFYVFYGANVGASEA